MLSPVQVPACIRCAAATPTETAQRPGHRGGGTRQRAPGGCPPNAMACVSGTHSVMPGRGSPGSPTRHSRSPAHANCLSRRGAEGSLLHLATPCALWICLQAVRKLDQHAGHGHQMGSFERRGCDPTFTVQRGPEGIISTQKRQTLIHNLENTVALDASTTTVDGLPVDRSTQPDVA